MGGTGATAMGGTGATAMGGTSATAIAGAPTGGTSMYSKSEIISVGGAYNCPMSSPSPTAQFPYVPCECPELPCECSYYYEELYTASACSEGFGLMVTSQTYACVGGIWRGIAGISAGTCGDPASFFGTGGAPGISSGGASSTGGAPSNGGASSNTAPMIEATGGSYACPQSESALVNAPCECSSPPCNCVYLYEWRTSGSCGTTPAPCKTGASFGYACEDGAWVQGSVPSPRSYGQTYDCSCDAGP